MHEYFLRVEAFTATKYLNQAGPRGGIGLNELSGVVLDA